MEKTLRNELINILQGPEEEGYTRRTMIKAIKKHREETGSSLADAKKVVEDLRGELHGSSDLVNIEKETPNSFRLRSANWNLNVLVKVYENGSMRIEAGLGEALVIHPMSVNGVVIKQQR